MEDNLLNLVQVYLLSHRKELFYYYKTLHFGITINCSKIIILNELAKRDVKYCRKCLKQTKLWGTTKI